MHNVYVDSLQQKTLKTQVNVGNVFYKCLQLSKCTLQKQRKKNKQKIKKGKIPNSYFGRKMHLVKAAKQSVLVNGISRTLSNTNL